MACRHEEGRTSNADKTRMLYNEGRAFPGYDIGDEAHLLVSKVLKTLAGMQTSDAYKYMEEHLHDNPYKK